MFNIQRCCRLCLVCLDKNFKIDFQEDLSHIIFDLFNFKIQLQDKISTKICNICFKKVMGFSAYKNSVISNQEIIENITNIKKQLIETSEQRIKTEKSDDNNLLKLSEPEINNKNDEQNSSKKSNEQIKTKQNLDKRVVTKKSKIETNNKTSKVNLFVSLSKINIQTIENVKLSVEDLNTLFGKDIIIPEKNKRIIDCPAAKKKCTSSNIENVNVNLEEITNIEQVIIQSEITENITELSNDTDTYEMQQNEILNKVVNEKNNDEHVLPKITSINSIETTTFQNLNKIINEETLYSSTNSNKNITIQDNISELSDDDVEIVFENIEKISNECVSVTDSSTEAENISSNLKQLIDHEINQLSVKIPKNKDKKQKICSKAKTKIKNKKKKIQNIDQTINKESAAADDDSNDTIENLDIHKYKKKKYNFENSNNFHIDLHIPTQCSQDSTFSMKIIKKKSILNETLKEYLGLENIKKLSSDNDIRFLECKKIIDQLIDQSKIKQKSPNIAIINPNTQSSTCNNNQNITPINAIINPQTTQSSRCNNNQNITPINAIINPNTQSSTCNNNQNITPINAIINPQSTQSSTCNNNQNITPINAIINPNTQSSTCNNNQNITPINAIINPQSTQSSTCNNNQNITPINNMLGNMQLDVLNLSTNISTYFTKTPTINNILYEYTPSTTLINNNVQPNTSANIITGLKNIPTFVIQRCPTTSSVSNHQLNSNDQHQNSRTIANTNMNMHGNGINDVILCPSVSNHQHQDSRRIANTNMNMHENAIRINDVISYPSPSVSNNQHQYSTTVANTNINMHGNTITAIGNNVISSPVNYSTDITAMNKAYLRNIFSTPMLSIPSTNSPTLKEHLLKTNNNTNKNNNNNLIKILSPNELNTKISKHLSSTQLKQSHEKCNCSVLEAGHRICRFILSTQNGYLKINLLDHSSKSIDFKTITELERQLLRNCFDNNNMPAKFSAINNLNGLHPSAVEILTFIYSNNLPSFYKNMQYKQNNL